MRRPALERAAQDADAKTAGDEGSEVPDRRSVVEHAGDDGLGALGAFHERQPRTGLEHAAIRKAIELFPGDGVEGEPFKSNHRKNCLLPCPKLVITRA
jgi:hypothetical protein